MNKIEGIDHDRLFKELILTFFVKFLELFFPQLMDYLEQDSITFLDKETFTDVTAGEKYEGDLIAQVKFAAQETYFLIHIEAQSTSKTSFNRRMFTYFARFHEKFALPVYPIVIFSYDRPQRSASNQYEVSFPDLKVLEFNYQVIQLNRLNWRDFLNQANPVASALMAKMRIEKKDRPKVKAECLRLLVTLKLNPAKMQLISGFIDTYPILILILRKKFYSKKKSVHLLNPYRRVLCKLQPVGCVKELNKENVLLSCVLFNISLVKSVQTWLQRLTI
jgi:hypothetical protein